MSAAYGRHERPIEDLTARARIRDAALAQFAEHGYVEATMKGVAEAAGVSVGLVQHHFGTKAGLRQACDDAVLELLGRKLQTAIEGQVVGPELMAALYESGPLLLAYLARAFGDGSSAAVAVFDQLVDGIEVFLTARWPERFEAGAPRTRAAATMLGAMSGGALALHPLVACRLGLEPWQDLMSPRLAVAGLDVHVVMGEHVTSIVGPDVEAFVALTLGETSAETSETPADNHSDRPSNTGEAGPWKHRQS